MKTCVVMPTYNEAKEIGSIIKKILELGLEIVIIDDGSLDNTSGIAANNGAIVLKNPNNEGKGASLVKGFDYAMKNNFDAVITMDGDGQHLAEDIPLFLQAAESSDNAVFIGNRMLKTKSMPWIRLITNKFMSWMISEITKQEVPDSQCGFRLIKKEALKRFRLKTSRYEIESEILIEASRLGFKIESVPIRTIYSGSKSQIRPFSDAIRFIKFLIKETWTTTF